MRTKDTDTITMKETAAVESKSPEFGQLYHLLAPHDTIDVAPSAGRDAPLNPKSVEMFKTDDISVKFLSKKREVRARSPYLGTALFDIAHAPIVVSLIKSLADANKLVAAVCRGSAAVLDVKLSNGKPLVDGLSGAMPFMLETDLVKNGAKYEKVDQPWGAKMVTGIVVGEVQGCSNRMREHFRIQKSLTKGTRRITRVQTRTTTHPQIAYANSAGRSLLSTFENMYQEMQDFKAESEKVTGALQQEVVKLQDCKAESKKVTGVLQQEVVKLQEFKAKSEEQTIAHTQELVVLRPLRRTGVDIRRRFYATFRRPREPADGDPAIIIDGNRAAHSGDVITDVSLFRHGLLHDDDLETFQELYGLGWAEAESLLEYNAIVAIMDKRATHKANPRLRWPEDDELYFLHLVDYVQNATEDQLEAFLIDIVETYPPHWDLLTQWKPSGTMPFMLETDLVKNGGKYEKADQPWGSKSPRSLATTTTPFFHNLANPQSTTYDPATTSLPSPAPTPDIRKEWLTCLWKMSARTKLPLHSNPEPTTPHDLHYYLTEGWGGVEPQQFRDAKSFIRAIESEAGKLCSGKTSQQYAVFAPITQDQFATIDRIRRAHLKGHRFHYFNRGETLIVKLMAGLVQEMTSKGFGGRLDIKIAEMGLFEDIDQMGSSTFKGNGTYPSFLTNYPGAHTYTTQSFLLLQLSSTNYSEWFNSSTVSPLGALIGAANAHTRVYDVYINDDVSSTEIICNVANNVAPSSVTAAADDKVTFDRGDDIIDLSSKGPITVNIAPIASQGAGTVWPRSRNLSVTLSSALAAGDYLLRAEIIALHEADIDYTIACSGTVTPPHTFGFVGGYSHADPGILFSLYGGATSYSIPGPAAWDGKTGSSVLLPSTVVSSTVPTAISTSSVPAATSVSTPARTTSTVAPTATPSVTKPASGTSDTVPKYYQCGGKLYTGGTNCVAGTKCTFQNEYYSQCL
ncbi:hypothetical protein B9Z19DRAFT_1137751 [Tuber borchii]|uniref:AA9 family lytic polysaccharide monooxygenase n=1 Tax=Tuber borchii TaxID=42251 RepID=A0A2T6ZA74_TUBBO|nr:hypothetical protein B9Z19DRAFT_1137751 [Tuber borchii]